MKLILPVIAAALGFSGSIIHAQEQPLTNWPTQDGQNVQVGQLACPLSVQGLNIRDSSGNLTNSIPLLTDPASVQASTQIGDTVYALIPPDGNNQATALIMYQTTASTSDEVNKAVQDAMNHNNWFSPTYTFSTPRAISASDQPLPAGTQFWVCSASGFVTFTDSGAISLAGPPAPVADTSDPGIASLLSLTNTTTSSSTSTSSTSTTTTSTTTP
jgi:hypothetical protein